MLKVVCLSALAYASAAPINHAAFLQPSVAPINEAFKPMVRGARPSPAARQRALALSPV